MRVTFPQPSVGPRKSIEKAVSHGAPHGQPVVTAGSPSHAPGSRRYNPRRNARRSSLAPSHQPATDAPAGIAALLTVPFLASATDDAPVADTGAAWPQPPPRATQQITRHNFTAVLPAVRQALEQCTFYAFDCEMTGLFPDGQKDDPLDDFEERCVVHSFAMYFMYKAAFASVSCINKGRMLLQCATSLLRRLAAQLHRGAAAAALSRTVTPLARS